MKYYSGIKGVWPLICAVAYYSGMTWLFHKLRPKSSLILTYHNVLPDRLFDGAPHLYVSHKESTFRWHLDLIEYYFSINHRIDALKPGECAITFDDGYQANVLAAEILEGRGLRGVFFIPMEPLLNGRTLVIDQMLQWFSYVPAGRYQLLDFDVAIASDDHGSRFAAFKDIYNRIVSDIGLWDYVPHALDTSFPFKQLCIDKQIEHLRFQPMSLTTVRALRKTGHTIGCHSWNHRPLAALNDASLSHDFENARKVSNSVCNTDVFSYPYGGPAEVDPRVVRVAKTAGFTGGVVNVDFWPFNGRDDPNYVRGRTSLSEGLSHYVLHAKLSGFEVSLKIFLSKIQRFLAIALPSRRRRW